MTEKRFTTVELAKPIKWGIWHDGAYISTYQICLLLNEYVDLKKENERLKSEYKVLHTQHQELRKFVENNFDEYQTQEKLNRKIIELLEENDQLKQREERLLSEIEDFQELLAKNDNVCHKRVIDLIDDKIFNFSNVKVELLLNSDDDYRLEKLSFVIQNLRELKEELSE